MHLFPTEAPSAWEVRMTVQHQALLQPWCQHAILGGVRREEKEGLHLLAFLFPLDYWNKIKRL